MRSYYIMNRQRMKTLFPAYPTREVNAVPLLAMVLYALLVTPVLIDLRMDIEKEIRIRARVQLWRLALRFDASVRRDKNGATLVIHESPVRPGANGMRMRLSPLVRMLFRSIRSRHYLRSRIRVCALTLDVRLGAGDAAYTAQLYGALHAVCTLLSRFLSRRCGILPHIDLRCEWRNAAFDMHAQGIITLLPGDIMAALVLAAARKLRKEAMKKWTGIPLKA